MRGLPIRIRTTPIWVALTTLAAATVLAGCSGGGEHAAATTEVVVGRRAPLPSQPDDPAWDHAPTFRAALVPQDMVEPRLTQPSTPEVWVRALTDGTRVAFRLEWPDSTIDDRPATGKFSDACAVQIPAEIAADVPAPQMGESGRPVEITYWRASWQAVVDGRPDTITAIHPNAVVDHYPFDAPALSPGSPEQRAMADRYAPARALHNEMAGPRSQPVQDLVAEGPGTIRPSSGGKTASEGRGRRVVTASNGSAKEGNLDGSTNGWAVVLVRSLPAGLTPGRRGEVAVAVWDGAGKEAGARKMRSGWIPLTVEVERR